MAERSRISRRSAGASAGGSDNGEGGQSGEGVRRASAQRRAIVELQRHPSLSHFVSNLDQTQNGSNCSKRNPFACAKQQKIQ
jgi:hypothetical protein